MGHHNHKWLWFETLLTNTVCKISICHWCSSSHHFFFFHWPWRPKCSQLGALIPLDLFLPFFSSLLFIYLFIPTFFPSLSNDKILEHSFFLASRRMTLASWVSPKWLHLPRKPQLKQSLPLPPSQASQNQGEVCSVMKMRKREESCLELQLLSHSCLKLKQSQNLNRKQQ